MAKVGRKAQHFTTAGGDVIPGLIHQRDGRWRILATGKRFTADSEGEAVATFYRLAARKPIVTFPVSTLPLEQLVGEQHSVARNTFAASIDSEFDEVTGKVTLVQRVDPSQMMEWAREFILTDPIHASRMLRLPGLANLDLSTVPAKAITIQQVIDLYLEKSESKQNTRGHLASAMKKLRAITGATTLAELTTLALMQFRDAITKELRPTGAAAIFGKVKSALSFARKVGLDAQQLDAALARMKVLYAPKADGVSNPEPITPADFHKLLATASPKWGAIFLVSLNMALYLADVAALVWEDFDLDAGTYVGIRSKTKIRRVGILWPETVAALKAVSRKADSPFVFPSTTGVAYRSDSLHRRYATIRDKAGITAPFSSLRDGAYTIAAQTCDDRTARMFAAHASGGLMDAYVQRRPELVKPAADAVHAAFGPFPKHA